MSTSIPEQLSLEGQVALVTGGSAGIGKATARALAGAGAAVCIVARDEERLTRAVEELEALGATAIGVPGSAVEPATRELSVRRCIDELGALDILVNNVGGSGPSIPIADVDEDLVRWTAELNLEAPLYYSQLAWRMWMSEHGGSIVNVTSLAGLQARPGYGLYGLNKAALGFLTKVMALEFAPKVRVNAVAPGMIVTELMMANTTPEYREMAKNRPLEALGDPEQVAHTVLMLLAPFSSYTTGQEIAIDGGALLI